MNQSNNSGFRRIAGRAGSVILLGCMLLFWCAGCRQEDSVQLEEESPQVVIPWQEQKGTITIATWDNAQIALFNELDIAGRFQESYPNVTIEVERSKDDFEYWINMKICAAANQLPDIMYNKPFTLSNFQQDLYDLSDTEAAKNNLLAENYAVDGKVLGLPEKAVSDYVYYWSDLFREAGVQVPDTWAEFEAVSIRLQEFYGGGKDYFAAIALGAKDEWTTYPLTEYMPCLVSGDGNLWNTIVNTDAPFAEGTDLFNAYQKASGLIQQGVFGRIPLETGHDQAVNLFNTRRAAMIIAGPWCLSSIREHGGDLSTLKTFYLPVRDSSDQPLRTVLQGDNMIGVTASTKYPELSKAFIEFYFSERWYPEYIARIGDDSTMGNFPKKKDIVLAYADEKETEPVLCYGGGKEFARLKAETKFDYKRFGSQMFVAGFDLEKELDNLNRQWTAARRTLKRESEGYPYQYH